MALKNYGVLKGTPVDRRLGSGANPHYQIKVADDDSEWRVAVNVQSQDGSEVEYAIIPDFRHPITATLAEMKRGFLLLPAAARQGLDYIRGNLVDPREFQPLPLSASGPDNDLNEKVDHYVKRAMSNEDAVICAFGETWGPESKRDKIFGFAPGRGIHDIHMNQGNSGQWARDNGPWQDGGLLFHYPETKLWVALLLRFQTQAWHTDETDGGRLGNGSGPPSDGAPDRLTPDTLPSGDRPDGLVRIVAAMVNEKKTADEETVTLLNASPEAIDLTGWTLLDSAENRLALAGRLGAGEAKAFKVRPALQLSNKGELITLLDKDGWKIDGVAYTRERARNPGWTIVF